MTICYRLEGIFTTRWYKSKREATDAYNRNRRCRHLHSIRCPGEVLGDAFEGGGSGRVHGVRDGHAMVTLRVR